MAQLLTYSSVVATGTGWSNGSNVSTNNNVFADCDNLGSGTSGLLKIALTNPTDPLDHTNHVIKVAVKATATGVPGSGTATINVSLRESGTQRASYSATVGLTEADKTYTLSTSEASNIGNYNNLEIWLEVVTSSGADGYRIVNVDYVELSIPDLAPPAPPTGVAATDGTYSDKTRVTWNASTGATGYNIYRSTSGGGGTYNFLMDVGGSLLGDDTTGNAGQTYWYVVRAYNTAGESGNSASDTGYRVLPSVSVTPATRTAGGTASVGALLFGSITITPTPAGAGTRTRSPLQLSDSDVDGFFQFLSQAHAYTNYGYRKRDTYFAIDQTHNTVMWLYPTTSSDAFTAQLPRVTMSYNVVTQAIGLGYPLPVSQTGTHVPLKTKNAFIILNSGHIKNRKRQNTILALGPATGTADDTTSNTEILDKEIYLIDLQRFHGIGSTYGNAVMFSKFFRLPTSIPNIATRISMLRPVFSHGNAQGLSMSGKIWTYHTYLQNDNSTTSTPTDSSSLIIDGGTILFQNTKFGLEHCFAIYMDTNNGASSWPPANTYSGGGIMGVQIFYTEQEEGFR